MLIDFEKDQNTGQIVSIDEKEMELFVANTPGWKEVSVTEYYDFISNFCFRVDWFYTNPQNPTELLFYEGESGTIREGKMDFGVKINDRYWVYLLALRKEE